MNFAFQNNNLEELSEIRIELPEQVHPIHAILTDNPSDVEAYLHKRFADKRAQGEWFALDSSDIQAFKRWKKIHGFFFNTVPIRQMSCRISKMGFDRRLLFLGDAEVRQFAIITISRARAAEYLDDLLHVIEVEPCLDNLRHAVRAIGELRSKRAVPVLLAIMDEYSGPIVGDAIGALGLIGAEEARGRIEELIDSDVAWIANQARRAIKLLDDPTRRIDRRYNTAPHWDTKPECEMIELGTMYEFFAYSDWANGVILEAAAGLSDEQLDQPFDMSMGSLRRVLLHILNGEEVWLKRWQRETETPWPGEDAKTSASEMAERFQACWNARDAFLESLDDGDVGRSLTYRDSKGKLFTATLGEMILQMAIHSTHHRAQVVNMIRRVGGPGLEMDYMAHIRKPADA